MKVLTKSVSWEASQCLNSIIKQLFFDDSDEVFKFGELPVETPLHSGCLSSSLVRTGLQHLDWLEEQGFRGERRCCSLGELAVLLTSQLEE